MKDLGIIQKKNWQSLMAEGVPRDYRSPLMDQLEEVSVSINSASLDLLGRNAGKLTLNDLSFIFRNFTCRRSVIDETFFDYICSQVIEQMDNCEISARFIRHLCSSLVVLNPPRQMPDLMNKLFHFFVSRPDPTQTHMKILSHLLSLCYMSNHNPPPAFLSLVSVCLIRDLDAIHGMHVLDTAMTLCLFR